MRLSAKLSKSAKVVRFARGFLCNGGRASGTFSGTMHRRHTLREGVQMTFKLGAHGPLDPKLTAERTLAGKIVPRL
jgi:hypothetical protein